MKTKFNGILTLFLALVVQISFAQEKTVSGTVTDDSGGLPGVSVLIKGTTKGTDTDFDGKYSIKVKVGDVLVFSYLGYKTVERIVGVNSSINVKLEEGGTVLDEVVVIGYGSGKKLGSVVGSVASISAKEIADRPSPSVMDGLQGRVAGLQVYTSSGEPSATPSFRLHGTGSLSGSSTPLIVIDGIPVDNGTLVSLNPNDFESVNVLKDASSTSIYGSRAANGVVYIVTKKGKKNSEDLVTVRSQYSITNLANQDFYDQMMNRNQLSQFFVETGITSQALMDNILQANPADTRWEDVYFKDNVPMIQNDISISGGGERSTYFISASHIKQEGLAYQSDFERYTIRTNITSDVKNWLKVGVNLSLGYDERQTNPSTTNSTNFGLFWLAQPWFSPVDENGDRYDLIPGWNRFHPEYREEKILSVGKNFQFNPSGFVQIKPIENLTIKTQAGLDFYDFTRNTATLPSFLGSVGNGAASKRFDRGRTLTVTNTAEYKFDLDNKNKFVFLLGHELIDNDFLSFGGSSTGQSDDRLLELDAGPDNQTVTESNSEYVFESFFGRIDYSYTDKYFFDFSLRQDGSSRFGANNRKTTFWSSGALWKVSKEDFLSDVNWLNALSLRASYGTSGNSSGIGDYDSLASVGVNQYNGSTGWLISNPGNDGLTWEEQSKLTIGINGRVLDRINFNVEFYNRKTSSMLVDVPFPLTSGFASITSNVGELVNRGIDVELSADVIRKGDLFFTPYVNFNYNKEEITELFQGRDFWIIPNTGVAWAVGQPISYFYPIHAGVNSQTGLSEWYVPGSDPAVNNEDPNNVTTTFNTAALQQNTGIRRNAPFIGGFGFNAGYKGFTLQADFSFASGKYLINNDRFFSDNPNLFPGFNQSVRVLDYWKQPGDVTRYPRFDGPRFTQFDSSLIEDASFIRMKNIVLSYNFSSDMIKDLGLKNLRFFAIGRNLLTFTNYTGPDPEVDSNLAIGSNPNTKQLSFGVEVTF